MPQRSRWIVASALIRAESEPFTRGTRLAVSSRHQASKSARVQPTLWEIAPIAWPAPSGRRKSRVIDGSAGFGIAVVCAAHSVYSKRLPLAEPSVRLAAERGRSAVHDAKVGGVHSGGIAGGDCHHWRAGRAAIARGAGGAGSGPPHAVLEQPEANRP